MHVSELPPIPDLGIDKEEFAASLESAFTNAKEHCLCLILQFSIYYAPNHGKWITRMFLQVRGRPSHTEYPDSPAAWMASLKTVTQASNQVDCSYDSTALAHLFSELMKRGTGFRLLADFRKSKGNVFVCDVFSHLDSNTHGKKVGSIAEAVVHEAAFNAGIPL